MENSKYDYLVFIGRFQPVHLGHIEMMREALRRADKLIVLCGAAGSARRMRNPWYEDERAAMIRAALDAADNARVHIDAVADYPEDRDWMQAVRDAVARIVAEDGKEQPRIAIFGHIKDETSYYLELFPDWGLVSVPSVGDYNATAIRKAYFQHNAATDFTHPYLPEAVSAWLSAFRKTDDFAWLLAEHDSIDAHKALWRDAPYPVNFVTTDAVVFHRGHILMIQRKHHPGKGLWALPGGYLDTGEKLRAGCLRELREETGWDFADAASCELGSDVYDTPTRSDRGRIITHVFAFQLADDAARPAVKGADDAQQAAWREIASLDRRECFDDHYAILCSWWEKMRKK